MKKRISAILMALVLALSLLPAAALAEGGVSTADALKQAVETALDGVETTIQLSGDINLSETLKIPAGKNIALDLNGHAITVPAAVNSRSIYAIDNYGVLAIADRSAAGNGSVKSRGIENYNALYMKSGTVQSIDSNGGGAAVWNEGYFEMTGGTLEFTGQKSGSSAGSPFNNQSTGSAVITGGQLLSPYTCAFNSGKLEMRGISLTSETDYWMTIKNYTGGQATLTDVSIETKNGGCVENAGGELILQNCNFKQTSIGNPAWNSCAIAVSNGGTTTVNGGTYSGFASVVYIYNSGGTANITSGTFSNAGPADAPVIKADASTKSWDSVVNVTGGTFTGTYAISSQKADLNIYGGSFSKDPTPYLDPSSNREQDSEGNWVVTPVPETEGVAEIDGRYYKTLEAAIGAAGEGDTVKVLKEITTSEEIQINTTKAFTLDLNGQTITSTNTNSFIRINGASLTITDSSVSASGVIELDADFGFLVGKGTLDFQKGTIISNANSGGYGEQIIYLRGSVTPTTETYTRFVLGKDAKIVSTKTAQDGTPVGIGYAVSVQPLSGSNSAYGVVVDIYGKTENAILYVSGNIEAESGMVPAVNLYDGAYIDGGIYAAGYAKWNIDGATVIGDTGMEIRAGELTVEDGSEITGTATPTTVLPNGNGSTTEGAGLAVAQHTTELSINVVINGGTIKGFTALYESNPEQNPPAKIGKVSMEVNGGSFQAINGGTNAVFSEDIDNFVNGGHFSSPVDDEYLSDTLNAELKSASNPAAPYSYYASINDAIAASKPGDTVKDLHPAAEMVTVTMQYRDGVNSDIQYVVEKGSTINLPAAIQKTGYEFKGWQSNVNGVVYPANTLVQVNSNTIFTAVYEIIVNPIPGHAINVVTDGNGTVTTTPVRAEAGETVTINVTPNAGYEVADITVTAVTGETIAVSGNRFTMPSASVTVKVTFVRTSSPFFDVTAGDWFYEEVLWAYENNVMDGVGGGKFAPNSSVSRAMVWTVLARIDGKVISGSDWADEARAWAMAEGVSDGTMATGNVTREQLATMLYRFAKYKGIDVSIGGDTNILSYSDADQVSDWAVEAMQWACGAGIINGMDGKLNPQGGATRAQMAAMLMRFVEEVA